MFEIKRVFFVCYRVDLLRNYTAIVLSAFVTAGLFEVYSVILSNFPRKKFNLRLFLFYKYTSTNQRVSDFPINCSFNWFFVFKLSHVTWCNFGVEFGTSHHYVRRFSVCSSNDSFGSITSYGK